MRDVACLGECGTQVPADLPFCDPCFGRMPERLRAVLSIAHETRDASLMLIAVTEAWAWHVAHPRRGAT